MVLILWLNLGQFLCLPNPLIPTSTSVHGADSTDYVGTFEDWVACSSSESEGWQFREWEVDGDENLNRKKEQRVIQNYVTKKIKIEIKIDKDIMKEEKGSEKKETDLRNWEEVKKSQRRDTWVAQ